MRYSPLRLSGYKEKDGCKTVPMVQDGQQAFIWPAAFSAERQGRTPDTQKIRTAGCEKREEMVANARIKE